MRANILKSNKQFIQTLKGTHIKSDRVLEVLENVVYLDFLNTVKEDFTNELRITYPTSVILIYLPLECCMLRLFR